MIAAKYGLYVKYDHPAGESLKNADSTLFLLFVLLSTVIIHPFVEELSFRLWLSKNRNRFFLGLGFCLIFFTLIFTEFNRVIPVSPELSFHLSFFLLGLALAYLLIKIFAENIELPPINLLIIISSILFSLLHLNVVGTQDNLIGYAIILLPYFISGYFHGYINYRIGFRYSFLVHALHNLTIASVSLMMR